jgi:hypothetical protein
MSEEKYLVAASWHDDRSIWEWGNLENAKKDAVRVFNETGAKKVYICKILGMLESEMKFTDLTKTEEEKT